MLDLNAENFEQEVINSNGIVVVKFWATWCHACKAYAIIFEEVAKKLPQVKFASVKVDDDRDLAKKYGVMGLPSTLIFKDGKQVNFISGLKLHDELTKTIKRYI